ncbi:MAG: aromatic ring-hydroxylating dioxygenase subunit alpha [Gammaproteobacteria bacterium]|nr:aromatic ring-hydroxylating dioxygenase subunit alpha [Gammaproteobacteria bacterium]MDH4313355.1 aromatic ring-hydroxylating dioxygenase subunit alpha [Gammaproteobacteria bacterium]MDH5213733.1 aromatic ring-hydroxylating dioxygenase subunit alpha [Gammaproteobacteria bacterium]
MTTLSRTELSLPSTWYYDPDHYAVELEAVWYRDWVCVGRLHEIPRAGDYFVATVGSQQLIVTRDNENQLRVFHNTCRHRGSILCTNEQGRFPNGRIICPYHTWTYSLTGALLATPARLPVDDFAENDYSLYQVNSACWGGFIFVCLDDTPGCTLESFLGSEAQIMKHWPLAEMISVQQDRKLLACNWKIFWENYSECYHCPRVHPELCKLVPLYQNGVLSYTDTPNWRPDDASDDGRPRVAPGLATWTLDGQTGLPVIPGLDEHEIRNGVNFASFTASMFVVAHPDYVRSVRVLPRGPESVELIVDWLLLPEVAETYAGEIDRMLDVGRLLIEQDGRVCEINQRGLRCVQHKHGVLVPQEYSLWEFHEWLRAKLEDRAL